MNLLTIEEAAERIGMSKGWIKQAIRSGELVHAKFGKCVRIRIGDLEEYIDGKIVGTTRSRQGSGGTKGHLEVIEKTVYGQS